MEHSLWAWHNSPLNVAMAVSGSWHEWGFIVISVLELFSVDFGRDGAVILTGEVYIEKSYRIVFFLFTCKLNTLVHLIEAFVEGGSRVGAVVFTS